MKLLTRMRAIYKTHKDNRFLKKHGVENWNQYYRRYDPDFSYSQCKIKYKYHGYPHVIMIDNNDHYAYTLLYDFGPGGYRDGYHEMEDWCLTNCKYKFRVDYLRVIQNYDGEWEENGIGGSDYLFFAFKDDKDAMFFKLRWL